ncbi:MAG: hypothetical protein K8R90_03275 [Candidatus Cloacimonetes bacterium]|nr:hypothetical protein [Candidatus Cloacimonadota bacterium]
MKSVFAFALLLICSLIAAETWIYEKTVVELPMGEAENQLGLILAPDGYEELDSGPTSFTIDEDENVYVLTRRKNIIKKFDKDGNYLCSSKYEGGVGDAIRFLGYHDGMIYTMSGDLRVPCIRRYTRELELVDYHRIRTRNSRYYGLSFIENTNGDYGFLSNNNPQRVNFCRFQLFDNEYSIAGADLFDFDFKKVDLSKIWPTGIGYRFLGYDNNFHFYIENLKGPLMATELGITTREGAFIHTNVEFDYHFTHGIHLIDIINLVISRDGCIYHILITEESIQFIKWERIRVEQ